MQPPVRKRLKKGSVNRNSVWFSDEAEEKGGAFDDDADEEEPV